MISVPELIERKRDGGLLEAEEIVELVQAYTRDDVAAEQMAAFCMAVYFRGLTPAETWALTDAMARSGEMVDLSAIGGPVVDKHSTGGVGDKVSIVLGPVVAACGVPFAKMSGRGLGHTGGTLDKLESIPGYRAELPVADFVRQVGDVGIAIVGQSEGLVPADRRLYALRDLTATVDEISLIAASIMSKKIAAGAHAILLDVKVGLGAFMKTRDDARRLAGAMLDIGHRAGRAVACELSSMDEPLGRAVGNALEIREAIATLRGDGPRDLVELVLSSTAHLLRLADPTVDSGDARGRAERALASGDALAAYERWIVAQGGDPREDALPSAPVVVTVPARAAGYVESVDALGIARAVVRLGAGRETKGSPIDHATGVVCLRKRSDGVDAGEPLAEVHARDEASAARAVSDVARSFTLGAEPVAPFPIVLETMG